MAVTITGASVLGVHGRSGHSVLRRVVRIGADVGSARRAGWSSGHVSIAADGGYRGTGWGCEEKHRNVSDNLSVVLIISMSVIDTSAATVQLSSMIICSTLHT